MPAWPCPEALPAAPAQPAPTPPRLARRRPSGGAARLRCAALAWLGAGLLAAPALAHQSSDAYLFFDQQAAATTLRWDIALRDLDQALDLDADGDRALTWGEVRRAWPRIDALALASLVVPGCTFAVTGHALEQRSDGAYAVLQLSAPCQLSPGARLHYGLLADIDPTHRGIVRHTVAGASPTVRMLVPSALGPAQRAEVLAASPAPAPLVLTSSAAPAQVEAPAGALAQPATAPDAPATAAPVPANAHAPSFIGEGVHHILTGYDHLLFLLCLLLPAVLTRQPGPPPHWQAVAGWRQALLPVVKTVTLFTLAHSVTLALASLGWVRLSPSFVEPAIAATIVLAALDNLRPLLLRWRGWVTFGFGLIHGFGFAGVLGELDLPAAQFGWALFQFNLGLEAGQLALVLRSGSALAGLLAAVWLVERTSGWPGLSS